MAVHTNVKRLRNDKKNTRRRKRVNSRRKQTKKIMRGGFLKFSNEEELNMEEIGKYYNLHKYETKTLLVRKNNLTEPDKARLPVSLEVSIDTKLDGSPRMTVKKTHLQEIINRHAELSGKGLQTINASVEALKQKVAKPLDKLALLPLFGIRGQVTNRYANRVEANVNVIDHTRTISQNNIYGTALNAYLVHGAPGVLAGELTKHVLNAVTSQPSNIVNRVVTAIQEKIRDSILLNNEVITRFYDIKVNNDGKTILYKKVEFNNNETLPKYLIPTSAGVDRKDGKFKVILTKEEYKQIEQIPHVRNLTDVHFLANLAALIPGKNLYDSFYRGMDKRSGVNIENKEHTKPALEEYEAHPVHNKHLEKKSLLSNMKRNSVHERVREPVHTL
jgi:hypothetical protein